MAVKHLAVKKMHNITIPFTKRKLKWFLNRYFLDYQHLIKISNKKVDTLLVISPNTICYPRDLRIYSSYPIRINIIGMLAHEIGHIVNPLPSDTFEQMVLDEEMAQKWAIQETIRINKKEVAKYLLQVFYAWRERIIEFKKEFFESEEHYQELLKNPYKEASLRNTQWIEDQLRMLG